MWCDSISRVFIPIAISKDEKVYNLNRKINTVFLLYYEFTLSSFLFFSMYRLRAVATMLSLRIFRICSRSELWVEKLLSNNLQENETECQIVLQSEAD